MPPAAVKVVAGAGYGGYEPLPALDASWVIHWVRGPRTAHLLGLPDSLGLGDPAMLLHVGARTGTRGARFGGHRLHAAFRKLARGTWHGGRRRRRRDADRPARRSGAIIAAIAGCRVLLSEALHGAIVADALRVPWIALRPLVPIHRAKWQDWAATLDLDIAFHRLPASSLLERLARLAACGASARSRLTGPIRRLCVRRRRGRFVAGQRGTGAGPRLRRTATLGCGGSRPLPGADAGSVRRAAARSERRA